MEAKSILKENLTLQPLMRLELLLASLLPVTAILLAGVIGTRWIMPAYIGPFTIIFLLCTVVIFLCEYTLIFSMQRSIKDQFSGFIAVCQAYQTGNKESRVLVQDNQDLTATLAQAINSLLDFASQQGEQQVVQKYASEPAEGLLKKRIKQLAHEIAPVLDADLSEKVTIADGDIGVVIDACNGMIEELVRQIKWTRGASEQIISVTREVVNSSIEFAQTIETQMIRLSITTETAEKLVAFVQRLSGTLQLSIDLTLEMQTQLEQSRKSITDKLSHSPKIVDSTPQTHDQQESLQQQTQLLEEALHATRENTKIAESMIGDLYAFAQQIHQSSTAVLSTAERVDSLATQAENWRTSVAVFHLPGEAYQNPSSIKESHTTQRAPITNFRPGEYS